jgi:malate synthase
VEITGPTQPKTAIDALGCRVNVWLADLEDASTPHWRNVVGGQVVRRVVAGEVAGIGELENQDDARRLFEQVAPADEFPDFLTLPACELIV